MDYSTACDIVGFTTPKSVQENARLATSRLSTMVNPRLRELLACRILIEAGSRLFAEIGRREASPGR